MPTYQNNQSTTTYAGITFPYGSPVAAPFFVPHEELIFTLVSDDPPVSSPVLFSGTIMDASIGIPPASEITISAITPDNATLYFADSDKGVPISSAAAYTLSGHWTEIGRIRVEGTAVITVERK